MTAIQTDALLRFARGDAAHRCTHTSIITPDSYFWKGSPGLAHIRYSTIDRLLVLGYIEDTEDPAWRWRGSLYKITAAGREAAAGLKS